MKRVSLPKFAAIALAVAVSFTAPAMAREADSTLIINARIIDGSGNAARDGAVRIRGDRIVDVGPLTASPGERTVDAHGLVLAPGFIDTHSHHDIGLADKPDALVVVTQGITTIVVNQDGFGSQPLANAFRAYNAAPAAVNIAAYSGHNYLRKVTLGEDYKRAATAREIRQMRKLIRADMKAGALGLSTGLEYEPGYYSTPSEVLALAKQAGRMGGRYISHIRSEDRDLWQAVDELLEIGRITQMPVQISHAKLAMVNLWGNADQLKARLQAARDSGIDVTMDVYPYDYWYGLLAVLWPKRDFTNRQAAEDIIANVAPADAIRFVAYALDPSVEGRTLAQVAADRSKPATDVLIDLATAADAAGIEARIVCRGMNERDVIGLLEWPFANVSSDGFLVSPHPRGAGSFPRVLRMYVTEQGRLSLETAIHKMTGLAAVNMGISSRGLIQPGKYADLVLFDPAEITDRATVAEPGALSVGIARVWVNGQEVLADGKPTGARPGRAVLRGE